MEEIVDHIPYEQTHEKVYTYQDWVDKYLKDMETLWNIGLGEISRVLDLVAPTRYRMIHEYSVIGNSM
jgi:hypothetical protein